MIDRFCFSHLSSFLNFSLRCVSTHNVGQRELHIAQFIPCCLPEDTLPTLDNSSLSPRCRTSNVFLHLCATPFCLHTSNFCIYVLQVCHRKSLILTFLRSLCMTAISNLSCHCRSCHSQTIQQCVTTSSNHLIPTSTCVLASHSVISHLV